MARTESAWEEVNGTYLKTPWSNGRDILINGTSKYLNFGSISGESGYGFRDNAGTMQVKNSGGSWGNFGSGGGGTVDTIVAGSGITVDATDPANPIVSATGGGVAEELVIAYSVSL
jgi:hypothetical protein